VMSGKDNEWETAPEKQKAWQGSRGRAAPWPGGADHATLPNEGPG